MAKKTAYGGVVFDDLGRVLPRKPKGEFDGHVWTFPAYYQAVSRIEGEP